MPETPSENRIKELMNRHSKSTLRRLRYDLSRGNDDLTLSFMNAKSLFDGPVGLTSELIEIVAKTYFSNLT